MKFEEENIIIWGYMKWNSMRYLARIEGKIDFNQYISILKGYIMSSLEKSGIFGEEMIFQQDNNSKYTSKKTKKWMEDNNIILLDSLVNFQILVLLNIKEYMTHFIPCLILIFLHTQTLGLKRQLNTSSFI